MNDEEKATWEQRIKEFKEFKFDYSDPATIKKARDLFKILQPLAIDEFDMHKRTLGRALDKLEALAGIKVPTTAQINRASIWFNQSHNVGVFNFLVKKQAPEPKRHQFANQGRAIMEEFKRPAKKP